MTLPVTLPQRGAEELRACVQLCVGQMSSEMGLLSHFPSLWLSTSVLDSLT